MSKQSNRLFPVKAEVANAGEKSPLPTNQINQSKRLDLPLDQLHTIDPKVTYARGDHVAAVLLPLLHKIFRDLMRCDGVGKFREVL